MTQKTKRSADVIVIGGGPAGLILTCRLAQEGIRVICIDRDDPKASLHETFDGRTTAISYGSRNIMEKADLWTPIEKKACAIKDIQILDDGSPVLLEFLVNELNKEAFGWIVENRDLRETLYQRIRDLKTAQHLAPAAVKEISTQNNEVQVTLASGETLTARLVIGADGRQSFTREQSNIGTRGWSYRQRALVCTVTHEKPHHNIAIEHFRPEGPFAVLPMPKSEKGEYRSSVVWTEHGPDKKSARHYAPDIFEAALNTRFPEWYGQVRLKGNIFSYPLGLTHAQSYVARRTALVADAAHGIHPIAGQGLNIGLRDVDALATILAVAHQEKQDLGSDDVLGTYQASRLADNMAMITATDTLNKLFSNDIGPLKGLRRIGLRTVNKINPARRFFMRQAMGLPMTKK